MLTVLESLKSKGWFLFHKRKKEARILILVRGKDNDSDR